MQLQWGVFQLKWESTQAICISLSFSRVALSTCSVHFCVFQNFFIFIGHATKAIPIRFYVSRTNLCQHLTRVMGLKKIVN